MQWDGHLQGPDAPKVLRYGCSGELTAAVGLMHVKNDNGTGLWNFTTIKALLGIGSINSVMRAHYSPDRPFIERSFGTLEMDIFKLLPGYTGRRPGELPGYDAVKNGVITVEQLYGVVSRYFIDEYPWCAADYYTKASSGHPFEARGLLVIGESRQGKSREIHRLLDKFNDASVIMPDGRPATIVYCLLSGKVAWKDLGVTILSLLGYELKGRLTQAHIWSLVIKYAELQEVAGIYFDEYCPSSLNSVKALTGAADHDRQDSQWQYPMASGAPVTSISTAPQKQTPFCVLGIFLLSTPTASQKG